MTSLQAKTKRKPSPLNNMGFSLFCMVFGAVVALSVTSPNKRPTRASLHRALGENDEPDSNVDEPEENDDEPEEQEEGEATVLSVWSIVIFLIVVTVIFEKTKESIYESASKDMLPIIESMFGEMTILGFLSVITFLCTKVGALKEISKCVFGEEEEEEMTEIFETVHYCLFAIMIFFVFQVIMLVTLGTQTESEWLALDRAVQDPTILKKIMEGHAGMEEEAAKFWR